ncbi:TonB-dependent receptor [Sphingobium sp. TCM1]|uniref:TonB-dependent receptor n=1 Tax=Sphingobium sp. TCM1 TaxID=453246 RepID=UPI0018DD0805|nr:TonB-dependent receptor [Sphingobium sp. TCM1]
MALTIGGALPDLAWAQAPQQGGASLDDIVVTAQRREESLQKVPISVTALGTEKLEQQQVTDVLSLTRVVPGLQAKPTLTPLEISVAIRGVTQLVPSINADPAIGSYIDGVYNVVNAGSNNAMIDMERVEVLKGPQGTLFGRNTIGGAISITTAKPTSELGGYVEGSYGNFNAWSGTAVLNVPLQPGIIDTRLVYQHSQHDGYGRNFTTGNPTSTINQDYFRGTVRLTQDSGLEALVSGFYTNAKGFGFPTNLAYFDPTNFLNGLIPALSGNPGDLLSNYVDTPGRGQHDSVSNTDSRFALRQFGVTGTLNIPLTDNVNFRSISAYTRTKYNTANDLDGTPYDVLELVRYPIAAKQYSQEMQLFGDAVDGALSWIGGVYYFQVTGSQFSNAAVLQSLVGPTVNVGGPFIKNISTSAFAQASYEIAPGLKITGGLRYVVDKRRVLYRDHVATNDYAYLVCNMANAPGNPDYNACRFAAQAKYHYLPFTIGIDYQVDSNTLVYAKLSRGFRSGAFGLTGPAATFVGNGITPEQASAANASAIAQFGPVSPERLVSPEVGLKVDLLDKRLRINAAGFYSDYSNIQLNVNGDVPAGCTSCTPPGILTNSGKARIWGGEIEVSAILGLLHIDGALGYADPKYVDGPQKGQPIVNISKLNTSLNATLPIETDAGTLTLGGGWSYRSNMVMYSLSPGLPLSLYPTFSQAGFSLFDARLSFALANMPLTITLFGQNLANKRFIAAGTSFAPPLGFTSNSPGMPRTYGLSARYSF